MKGSLENEHSEIQLAIYKKINIRKGHIINKIITFKTKLILTSIQELIYKIIM